jgi:hypothetical protein
MAKRSKKAKRVAANALSIYGTKFRRDLAKPEQVFSDMQTLMARHEYGGRHWEDELWGILAHDNPDAAGWFASDFDADALESAGFGFEKLCNIYEGDLDVYVRLLIKEDPDEYLGEINPKNSADFALFRLDPREKNKESLTEDEIWKIFEDRFADRIAETVKAAAQKEVTENLEYYLPMENPE